MAAVTMTTAGFLYQSLFQALYVNTPSQEHWALTETQVPLLPGSLRWRDLKKLARGNWQNETASWAPLNIAPSLPNSNATKLSFQTAFRQRLLKRPSPTFRWDVKTRVQQPVTPCCEQGIQSRKTKRNKNRKKAWASQIIGKCPLNFSYFSFHPSDWESSKDWYFKSYQKFKLNPILQENSIYRKTDLNCIKDTCSLTSQCTQSQQWKS